MKKEIPAPLMSILSENFATLNSHNEINNLFLYADAPGSPPEEPKKAKVLEWLRRINKESDQPLKILGRLIENYMELPEKKPISFGFGMQSAPIITPEKQFKDQLIEILSRCNLTYTTGGIISDGGSAPSQSLGELIKKRNIPSIDAEFARALSNVNSEPREAVSAACNILESIFKIYITDEELGMPQKQDIQSLWKLVRSDLGFDPSLLQDDDLKKILSGILSVVDGIGAFRTHASSAHGEGPKSYNLKPRHARLAINSAHTIALFVLETWDERKNN